VRGTYIYGISSDGENEYVSSAIRYELSSTRHEETTVTYTSALYINDVTAYQHDVSDFVFTDEEDQCIAKIRITEQIPDVEYDEVDQFDFKQWILRTHYELGLDKNMFIFNEPEFQNEITHEDYFISRVDDFDDQKIEVFKNNVAVVSSDSGRKIYSLQYYDGVSSIVFVDNMIAFFNSELSGLVNSEEFVVITKKTEIEPEDQDGGEVPEPQYQYETANMLEDYFELGDKPETLFVDVGNDIVYAGEEQCFLTYAGI
jgi:hypothetical protein